MTKPPIPYEALGPGDDNRQPLLAAISKRDRRRYQRAMSRIRKRLTPRQRELVENVVFLGKCLQDYAAERGVSYSTVWRTYRRALNRLGSGSPPQRRSCE